MKKTVIYLLEIGNEKVNDVYVYNNILYIDYEQAKEYGAKHLKEHEDNYFMIHQDIERLSNKDIQAIKRHGATEENEDIIYLMQTKENRLDYQSRLKTQDNNNDLAIEYVG